MGVSITHIGDLERGYQRNPKLGLLLGLVKALDLTSVEQLLTGVHEWGTQAVLREIEGVAAPTKQRTA